MLPFKLEEVSWRVESIRRDLWFTR